MIENVDEKELKKLIKVLVHQQFFVGHDTIVDRMKHTEQKINGSGEVINKFISILYDCFVHSDDYIEIIKGINKKFGLVIDEAVIQENIELAREDGQSGIDLAMFPLADTISAFREKAYDRCEEIIYNKVKDLFENVEAFKNTLRLMFQKNDEDLSLFLNLVVFDNMVREVDQSLPELKQTLDRLLDKIRANFINANPHLAPKKVQKRLRDRRPAMGL